MATRYLNYAFISYSHSDKKEAAWLQRQIEHFRLPEGVHNICQPGCSFIRPVFRDMTDLTTGILSHQLDENLRASRFLIVICSRRSAQSEWVNREVQTFIEMGRFLDIIPVVVDGLPYRGGEQECMPAALIQYAAEHPGHELLGIDLQTLSRTQVCLSVISRMLDIDLDTLYNRYRRHRLTVTLRISVLIIALLAAIFFLVSPIYGTLRLHDDDHRLPLPDDARIVLHGSTELEFPISSLDTLLVFPSTLGYNRGRTYELDFYASYYDTLHTTITLGFGFRSDFEIQLRRDSTFSVYAGEVLDAEGLPIPGALVKVAGLTDTTDPLGHFHLSIPVPLQQVEQSILIMRDGYREVFRSDECPSASLKYIMYAE